MHGACSPGSDFHINISFPLLFLHAFLLVSAAYITWMRRPSTKRAEGKGGGGRSGRGGHYHTVCLHQCAISIIGPVIETNHSLSVAVAQATHIQISFRLCRKIGAGGINLWSIPNILPTIWAALGGLLYISMGGRKQFAWDVLHYSPKNDKIGHSTEATKTSLIALLNFTVTRPGVMRWLRDSPRVFVGKVQYHFQCKKESM